MLKILLKQFIQRTGRKPNALEMLQLKFKAAQQSGKGQIIQFPKDRITDWTKARPTSELQSGIMKATGSKPTVVKTEAQIKSGIEAGNKAAVQKMKIDKLRKDVLKEIENRKNELYIGNIIDPEDYGFKVSDGTWTDEVEELMQMLIRDKKAGGGVAGMLGEPTYQDEDHRIPFKLGGIDKARRLFLQAMGAGAAGIGAAKSGLLNIFKGGAKKEVIKDLTQVPIGSAEGMPAWFKPLVNKVIKEGDDVTKKLATEERQIVHNKKLNKFDDITVTQDLDEGIVRVEYYAGDNMGQAPIQLEYRAPQDIFDTGPARVFSKEYQATKKAAGGTQYQGKSKPEFSAVEAEPRIANWEGDIEWDGENIVSKVDDLLTDTTKLEAYATGKKPTIKKLLESEKKQKRVNRLHDDTMEQVEYIENKEGMSAKDYIDETARVSDFGEHSTYHTKGMNLPDKTKKASGGRVPFVGGGWAFKLATKYRQSKQYKNYIEKLFVKTSNDIRRGEGLFKNLSSNEKIKLHDDLTKEVTNYQKTGELPKSAHQYFGFNPEQKYADKLLQKQLKMTGDENLDYDWVETPEGWVKKPGSEGAFYRFGEENKELIDKGIKNITAADELRREFPGITDDLVNKILTDTNKQRIAEVKATMKEALKMQEKGMGTEEIIQTFKKTPRTKNADGGLAGMLGE